MLALVAGEAVDGPHQIGKALDVTGLQIVLSIEDAGKANDLGVEMRAAASHRLIEAFEDSLEHAAVAVNTRHTRRDQQSRSGELIEESLIRRCQNFI